MKNIKDILTEYFKNNPEFNQPEVSQSFSFETSWTNGLDSVSIGCRIYEEGIIPSVFTLNTGKNNLDVNFKNVLLSDEDIGNLNFIKDCIFELFMNLRCGEIVDKKEE